MWRAAPKTLTGFCTCWTSQPFSSVVLCSLNVRPLSTSTPISASTTSSELDNPATALSPAPVAHTPPQELSPHAPESSPHAILDALDDRHGVHYIPLATPHSPRRPADAPATQRSKTVLQQARDLAASVATTPAGQATIARARQRQQLMELVRRHNCSLPNLLGQVVTASVLHINNERLLVDPHFHGISEIPRQSVNLSHLHNVESGVQQDAATARGSSSGSSMQLPQAQAPPQSIRVGDKLRLRISELYTPYGDMELQPVQRDLAVKTKMVWNELVQLYRSQRKVMGRVLNSCPGGYAVGVGGVVALLPYANSVPETAYNIGVLQSFEIMQMDTSNPPRSDLIVLRDPTVLSRRA